MTTQLSLDAARELTESILSGLGASAENAAIIARIIVEAESNGTRSHGLMRLADYAASIRTGWLNPQAEPSIEAKPGSFVATNCHNGFTQVAVVKARGLLLRKVAESGLAVLTVRNGHHIGPLWCDVEPLAQSGFVAITFVNSRSRLAPYGAHSRLLGTNAMAFSSPDGTGGSVTWDQSSSVMSQGDLKLHALSGRTLPPGVGLSGHGSETNDAAAVLNGGALLPFGGHKGSSIALMVEVMAAALTGGNFGFEDDSPGFPGAASSNAGQFLIVIDPLRSTDGDVSGRLRTLFAHLRSDPAIRLPGDRRRGELQHATTHGICLSDEQYSALIGLLPSSKE